MERSQSSQEPGTSENLEEASCDCRAESEEKGALRVVLPSPQMAGSAEKEWGGDEGLGIGECLSVLRGPQPLALIPSLLFTELLAAKKTHTCE